MGKVVLIPVKDLVEGEKGLKLQLISAVGGSDVAGLGHWGYLRLDARMSRWFGLLIPTREGESWGVEEVMNKELCEEFATLPAHSVVVVQAAQLDNLDKWIQAAGHTVERRDKLPENEQNLNLTVTLAGQPV